MEDNFWNDERVEEYVQSIFPRFTKEHFEDFKRSKASPKDDVRDRITAFRKRSEYKDATEWLIEQVVKRDVDYYLYHKDWGIYSVKNDKGVEFKIGDVCVQGKIEKIFIDTDGVLRASTIGLTDDRKSGSVTFIDSLTKADERVPLFPLDGIKVFDDTPVWIVWSDNKKELYEMEYIGSQCDGVDTDISKHFISKEKALQYISRNKKSISYQELHDFCIQHGSEINGILSHFKPENNE